MKLTPLLLAIAAAGLVTGIATASSGSTHKVPGPRVGVSGTIGPVCARNADGVLRFIKLGQHWLNVQFARTLVRVPFRIMTEEEEKMVSKNFKDIKKQVQEAFKKPKPKS